MDDLPKIPDDRPTSWSVDEDNHFVEQPILFVNPLNPDRRFDDFGAAVPPFHGGLALGGAWHGDAEDFTVETDRDPKP